MFSSFASRPSHDGWRCRRRPWRRLPLRRSARLPARNVDCDLRHVNDCRPRIRAPAGMPGARSPNSSAQFSMATIAIVGAGPAGSAAAWHLATRGHAVTLFDRAEFPRDKTCGDWLTPAALSELAVLGLDADALRRGAPDHATITRTLLVAPGGGKSAHESAMPGRCIPRRVLDAMLLAQATRVGGEFVRSTLRDV